VDRQRPGADAPHPRDAGERPGSRLAACGTACAVDPTRTWHSRVKGREPFRPFAPAVALEHVEDWFDLEGTPAASPFMLRVCRIRESMRARVPGVVHVDGTGRLQSVERGSRFHALLTAFHARTGVPMVVDFCVLEDRRSTRAEAALPNIR
jgi:hypothetical protein